MRSPAISRGSKRPRAADSLRPEGAIAHRQCGCGNDYQANAAAEAAFRHADKEDGQESNVKPRVIKHHGRAKHIALKPAGEVLAI